LRTVLKLGDALSPLLLNFKLKSPIIAEHEASGRLYMSGSTQELAYVEEVILIGDYIKTIEGKTYVL
jgi:hypothetical protein